MNYKFNDDFSNAIEIKHQKYEVMVLMKGYNVWHKDTETTNFELAIERAKKLEKDCECWTEIKFISTYERIYRRYKKE